MFISHAIQGGSFKRSNKRARDTETAREAGHFELAGTTRKPFASFFVPRKLSPHEHHRLTRNVGMFGMDLHASICTSPYKVVAKDAQILLASASVPRELQEHLTITTAPGQGRSQAVSDWSPPPCLLLVPPQTSCQD